MIRTYEAGVAIMIVLVALVQFVMLSAGRLGEQWDSTELDVEVKKALEVFQTQDVSGASKKYSKIRDSDLLRMPQSESVGYRLLINGQPVDKTIPPPGAEVAAADARAYYDSKDAPRLVTTLNMRLLRSSYVQFAGRTMDYDSVDELADLILGLIWDAESEDILNSRVGTLMANQNPDGGWGFVRDEESDALCTSLAVRALSAWIKRHGGVPLSNATVTRGIAWLKDRVHADGGYGSKERIESSIDMTSLAILAFHEAGLDKTDPWVTDALGFLTRSQGADGGFPLSRLTSGDLSSTALAIEALMALGAPQARVEKALAYLGGRMVTDGDFTFEMVAMGGLGTYDLTVYSGYIVDCSPRGHEFWGEYLDDSRVMIMDVYGTRDNLTVILRVDRSRLEPPDNKQKVALALSHDMASDTSDYWILNAGNPHTSGQGKQIDSPQFNPIQQGRYTYLTVTGLQIPMEYDFFSDASGDWLIAFVGDEPHPIQDNPGRGYLIGYWHPWMKAFSFDNILAWRAWSPRVNRVCLDTDKDFEFDDRRITVGDSIWVFGREWVLGMEQTMDELNLTFLCEDINQSRSYYPVKYDLSTIPASASGLYHFGVISTENKPSFSRNYKIILRDSAVKGEYDEAYIWNGSHWNLFREGSIWNESGTLWVVGVEVDFLVLTRSVPSVVTGLSGRNSTTMGIEGDFVEALVTPRGPKEVWLTLYYGSEETDRVIFKDSASKSLRRVFGTWQRLRETSRVYNALAIAEGWLQDPDSARAAHDMADLCQQAVKFNKVYNSVIEDRLRIEAWFRSQGG